MGDFKKLVKKLRYCSNPGNCNLKCPYFSFDGDCIVKITKEAADVIEDLQSAVPKWHPVSEPPKENKEYLVYIPNVGLVTKANYLYGEWNYDSLHMKISHLLSHWMPLPEPPKEVYGDGE